VADLATVVAKGVHWHQQEQTAQIARLTQLYVSLVHVFLPAWHTALVFYAGRHMSTVGEGGISMLEELLPTIPRCGVEILPVSIMGWLGIRLLAWSAGNAEGHVRFGGPCTFLVIFGLAAFASCETLGRSLPALNTICLSLLILGLLASLARAVAEIRKKTSRRR
jgi:hypothetical protein